MTILKQPPTFNWILYLPQYSSCTVCCSVYSYDQNFKFSNDVILVCKIHELGSNEQPKVIGELKKITCGWSESFNFIPRNRQENSAESQFTSESQKKWNAYVLSVGPSIIEGNGEESFVNSYTVLKARCAVSVILPLRSINYLGIIYDDYVNGGSKNLSPKKFPLFCDTGASVRSSIVAINPTLSSLFLKGLSSEVEQVIVYPSSAIEIDLSKSFSKDTKFKFISWSNNGGVAFAVHKLAADGEVILVDCL